MNKLIIHFALLLIVQVSVSCSSHSTEHAASDGHAHQEKNEELQDADEHEAGVVHLSELQFNSLGMLVDTMPLRSLAGVVEANGQLEVPPQHEATVTAILGANVMSIKVIEGDKVKKGQALAWVSHPNLTRLQTEFVVVHNKLQFLEKEYERQKKLYEEQVGSGKSFQQTEADYLAMKGEVNGYATQLRQLHLNVNRIRKGELYEQVPVISPIDGYIEKVLIQIGQYVDPQTEMFRIVNLEHIHADLMVFEKDVYKVKKGQKISFTVESVPGTILSANIYSVGKQFEQNPKAVHVHAEIDRKQDFLIPGMYINGKIHTESRQVQALPEGALVDEDGKTFLFLADAHQEESKTEWAFTPVEVKTGMKDEGWVEIRLLEELPKDANIALNNAYYLIAEMKKSQTSHAH